MILFEATLEGLSWLHASSFEGFDGCRKNNELSAQLFSVLNHVEVLDMRTKGEKKRVRGRCLKIVYFFTSGFMVRVWDDVYEPKEQKTGYIDQQKIKENDVK